MYGRDYCVPDDVQVLVPAVFAHRIDSKSRCQICKGNCGRNIGPHINNGSSSSSEGDLNE